MNDQQFPPDGQGSHGQHENMPPGYQIPFNEIPVSSYHIDKDGNVYKDKMSTICMFAPRPMFQKPSLELGPKAGKDAFEQMTYPCTTRCTKCNVIAQVATATNLPIGFNLEISCNGSIGVYPLPMPEETQAPQQGSGMKAVR